MKNHFPILSDTMPTYLIAILIAAGVAIVFAIVLLFVFLKRGSKKKAPKVDNSKWLEALGGKDNVVTVTAVGSRINLTLKDKETINRNALTEYGVKSVLIMSSKITLVVNDNASKIANAINEALSN